MDVFAEAGLLPGWTTERQLAPEVLYGIVTGRYALYGGVVRVVPGREGVGQIVRHRAALDLPNALLVHFGGTLCRDTTRFGWSVPLQCVSESTISKLTTGVYITAKRSSRPPGHLLLGPRQIGCVRMCFNLAVPEGG
jgi:hypothetical protein